MSTEQDDESIGQHLKELFEEEVWEAGIRLVLAMVAEKERFTEVAACMKEIGHDEAKHAFLIAQIILPEDVRDTRSNLQGAMEADTSARSREARFAEVSRRQGRDDVAALFERLSSDEAQHVSKLEACLKGLEAESHNRGTT